MNFVRASKHALGIGRTPNDWEDLTKAKAVRAHRLQSSLRPIR